MPARRKGTQRMPDRTAPRTRTAKGLVRPPGVARSLCGQCGYDLQGVDASLCPECGTPRQDAVAGGLLEEAAKPYLLRLRRGLRLIYWGLVAEIVFSVMWLAAAFTYMALMADPAAQTTTGTRLASQALFEGLGIFLMQIPLALQLAGAWWYTQPEIEHLRERPQTRWRWLTLGGFTAAIVGKLTSAILVWCGFPGDPFDSALTGAQTAQGAVVLGTQVLAACGALLGLVGLLGFTQRIADRADDAHNERHVGNLKYALIVLFPLGAVWPLLTWVALILCLMPLGQMLRHVKHAIASKPEFEVEEYVHARPLA